MMMMMHEDRHQCLPFFRGGRFVILFSKQEKCRQKEGQVRTCQVRSGPVGSGRSGRVRSCQVRSGRVGSVMSRQVGSGRVRSGQVGSGQVHSSNVADKTSNIWLKRMAYAC